MVDVVKNLGLLLSPTANNGLKDNALKILPRVRNSGFYSPAEETETLPGKIVVVGGEGTIRSVVQDMVQRDEVSPIGLLAGGTNNVLYRTLLKRGYSMCFSDFMEYGRDELARRFSLRPGLFEQSAFTTHIGLGLFEQSSGIINENLRGKLPGRLRLFASTLMALQSTLSQGSNTLLELNLYSLTPFVRSKEVFPNQDLTGDLITHANILGQSRAERMRNLLIITMSWQLGKIPPSSILEVEQACSFTLDTTHSPAIWIDGDTKPLHSDKKEAVVTRWDKAIPIVAITYI